MSPKAMEKALKKEARKKHMNKEEEDRYVYGTMRKTGWKPKKERK